MLYYYDAVVFVAVWDCVVLHCTRATAAVWNGCSGGPRAAVVEYCSGPPVVLHATVVLLLPCVL